MKNNYSTTSGGSAAPAPSGFPNMPGYDHVAYEGAILFHPGGKIEAVEPLDGRVFSYGELVKFVGGYIEVLPFHSSGRWMVINENGKGDTAFAGPLPENGNATLLARANGLPADDYIAGPALLCRLDQMNTD